MAQPAKKSNSVLTSTFDLVLGTIVIEVVGITDKITFDAKGHVGAQAYDALHENGKRALLHGFLQRLSDRAAIQRDAVTGQSATPAEKHAAIKSLRDHYAGGGTWELKGGGVVPLNRAALFEAVANVQKKDPKAVAQHYAAKEDLVLRTLLTIPKIAARYTEITRPVAKDVADAAAAMLKELDTK